MDNINQQKDKVKQTVKVPNIEVKELVGIASELAFKGYRFVQMCCTKLEDETLEFNYSFDKDYNFLNLRFIIKAEEGLPSICDIYWSAFTYENEIQDLFGVNIKNLDLNYQGQYYRTTIKSPYNIIRKVTGEN